MNVRVARFNGVGSQHTHAREGMEDTNVSLPRSPVEWNAFFLEQSALVERVLRHWVRPSEIEDLMQEVFVVIYRKLPGFEGRSQLSTWIYGVCTKVASAHVRKQKNRARLFERFRKANAPKAADDSPEDWVIAHQSHRRVRSALETMSAKKREVFVLRELEGLSGPDVARALSISETTMRARLFHARKAFAHALEVEDV